ncbi:hypothetical protein Tco_1112865 [Tanacetum coccineum]|uniref:Uncharacterized protein n=1 Tax=Tanacetum coccineum TaxID=301880 RepID=A0ABQ5IQL5_9ASTR
MAVEEAVIPAETPAPALGEPMDIMTFELSRFCRLDCEGVLEDKLVAPSPGKPARSLKDYAIIDSGCSGSMTGDKDKLSDFKGYKGSLMWSRPANQKFNFSFDDSNWDARQFQRSYCKDAQALQLKGCSFSTTASESRYCISLSRYSNHHMITDAVQGSSDTYKYWLHNTEKVMKTKEVNIEEKEASNVKSGKTEEQDLRHLKVTAIQEHLLQGP